MLRKHWSATRLLAAAVLLAPGCGDSGRLAAPLDTGGQVVVSPRSAALEALGDKLRLTAALNSARSTVVSPSFSWISLNPSVATVDAAGEVTAIGVGDARIVARSSALGDTAVITVSQVPASITIQRRVLSGAVTAGAGALAELTSLGDTIRLEATVRDRRGNPIPHAQPSWSSLDPAIVQVAADGNVSAVGNGTGRILARSGTTVDTARIQVQQIITRLELRTTSATLRALGDTLLLHVAAADANGRDVPPSSITWRSLAQHVAAVSTTGRVTAIANGTAAVVATAGALADTALITVQQTAASVVLYPASLTLGLGQAATLTATAYDQRGAIMAGLPVAWVSSNPGVASVDLLGRATGLSAGSASITATIQGVSSAATVTVHAAAVAAVAVAPTSGTIAPAQTLQLTATLRDANFNLLQGRVVTWTSANPAVAAVSQSGLVTGLADGSTVITASAEGRSGSATITVRAPVATIALTPQTLTLTAGATRLLTATPLDAAGKPLNRPVTWVSSNSAIVSVDANGLATARAAGSANVYASSEGVSATAAISVPAPPVMPGPVASITLSPASANLQVGGSLALLAVLRDAQNNILSDRTVTWSSSNPAVSSVSPTGAVTALAAGAATITASAEGKSAAAQITVTSGPPAAPTIVRVVVSPARDTLDALGATAQLVATAFDANGTAVPSASIGWLAINQSVATVDGGKVTAKGVGTALIVAVVNAACADTTEIVVRQLVDSVTTSPASVILKIGSTVRLNGQALDRNGNPISSAALVWSSLDTTVATVDSDGHVKSRGEGTTTIRASHGSRNGNSTIIVPPAEPAVSSVVIAPNGDTLTALAATRQLIATARDGSGSVVADAAVRWISLNNSIATVDGYGIVTARSVGTALIVATAACCSSSDTVAVVVRPVVASVAVQPGSASLAPGSTASLSASAKDANGYTVPNVGFTWSSSAPAVASVDATGKVTAAASGSATITASSGGIAGSAVVTVATAPVALVAVTPGTLSLPQGTTATLQASAKDIAGNLLSGVQFSWTSSNPAVATVSASGVVTAVTGGTATITASSSGQTAATTVTVTAAVPPPAGVVWSDGFESGGISTVRNGYRWLGTANPVVSTIARTGKYSYRFTYAGNNDLCADASAEQRFTLGDDFTEVWFEYYIFVPNGTEGVGPKFYHRLPTCAAKNDPNGVTQNNKFFAVWDSAYNPQHVKVVYEYRRSVVSVDGDSRLYGMWCNDSRSCSDWNHPNGRTDPIFSAATRGRWVQIRIHVRLADSKLAANGFTKLWVDGQLKIDMQGLDLAPGPGGRRYLRNGYLFGWANSGFNQITYIYLDDFAVYGSNPGW